MHKMLLVSLFCWKLSCDLCVFFKSWLYLKINMNLAYLKVIGNFLFKSSADLKSSTISLQTTAGLSQSGFPGHQFLCFLDCNDPLGSRIKSKILTFKLQINEWMVKHEWILKSSLQITLRSIHKIKYINDVIWYLVFTNVRYGNVAIN